ncbi:MAG: hypothetical protein GXY20_07240 [Clostridiales bacterium]|nr:hypothetical protein [Clostridiales bacterium]
MRALIVSASTGYGHNSASRALVCAFKRAGIQAECVDFYEVCGRVSYSIMDKGYVFVTRHMKKSYRRAYGLLERSGRCRSIYSAAAGRLLLARRFLRKFDLSSFDVILTTHPYVAQEFNMLKSHHLLNIPVVSIITDYCIQPFFEECKYLDAIVISSPRLKTSALEKGLDPVRVFPLGLPVDNSFLSLPSTNEARISLGFEPDKDTVLVMGGSMGYGNIYSVVTGLLNICGDVQIICVCGTNVNLFRSLSNLEDKRLLVLGFTNKMALCMSAADCAVTKPGGLTVAELLVTGLPAVIFSPIPGQEERNCRFITGTGGAVYAESPRDAANKIMSLLSDKKQLLNMKEALSKVATPSAADDICALAVHLAGR